MSSWNYRVMKHANGDEDVTYEIHEAFYDDDGNLKDWTAEPVSVSALSVSEITSILSMMARAVDLPILEAGTPVHVGDTVAKTERRPSGG